MGGLDGKDHKDRRSKRLAQERGKKLGGLLRLTRLVQRQRRRRPKFLVDKVLSENTVEVSSHSTENATTEAGPGFLFLSEVSGSPTPTDLGISRKFCLTIVIELCKRIGCSSN